MRPEIKQINGAGFEWEEFTPSYARNFECWLQIGIGPADDNSIEFFQLRIVTPLKLEENIDKDGPIFSSNTLFVQRFDRELINRKIADTVAKLQGENWEQIRQQQLVKLMQSEYE